MQFLFIDETPTEELTLSGEEFNYLFKVRRHRKENPINIRNRKTPETLYSYKVDSISRRDAKLILTGKVETEQSRGELTVGWCLPTVKTVEKTIPMLNELGVKKLSLIRCDYSQGNIKVDLQRLQTILENSSMQSGRIYPMKVELIERLEDLLAENSSLVTLDFVDEVLNGGDEFRTILVGSEGGFSESERELFREKGVASRRLPSNHILKSETAVVSAVSRIL